MSVQATLVIEYGDGADSSALVIAELDDVNNGGKTRFQPPEEAWWWLHHDPSLRVGSVAVSAGSTVAAGAAQRSRSDSLTFTPQDMSQELSGIPAGSVAMAWTGNVGSGFGVSGRTASVTGNTPCLGTASYSINVQLYRYVPPAGLTLAAGETFQALIVVTMVPA